MQGVRAYRTRESRIPEIPKHSSHTSLPPRPIPVSCQLIFSSRPLCLIHPARTLAQIMNLPLFPIRPHGLSSSHICIERVQLPLPRHHPFTTSCQVSQLSRRPPCPVDTESTGVFPNLSEAVIAAVDGG
jgi:hypothetical protein